LIRTSRTSIPKAVIARLTWAVTRSMILSRPKSSRISWRGSSGCCSRRSFEERTISIMSAFERFSRRTEKTRSSRRDWARVSSFSFWRKRRGFVIRQRAKLSTLSCFLSRVTIGVGLLSYSRSRSSKTRTSSTNGVLK